MDTIAKHKAICKALVLEIADLTPDDDFTATQAVIDDQGGHYILFDIGWYQTKRVYLPFVHIDVTETGKVWIQHDGTDLRIAERLAEKGIPKKQIVIGFRAPQARALMEEYAVE